MRNTFQWQADQNTLGTSLVTALFTIHLPQPLYQFIHAGHFSVAGGPKYAGKYAGYELGYGTFRYSSTTTLMSIYIRGTLFSGRLTHSGRNMRVIT